MKNITIDKLRFIVIIYYYQETFISYMQSQIEYVTFSSTAPNKTIVDHYNEMKSIFCSLSDQRLDEELAKNARALKYFPKKKMTTEHVLKAVQTNPELLRVLDWNKDTERLLATYVPSELTHALVNQDVESGRRARKKMYFLLDVVRTNPRTLGYLDLNPGFASTTNLLREVVGCNGLILEFIDPKFLTFDLMVLAVRQNPDALQFVRPRYHHNVLRSISGQ